MTRNDGIFHLKNRFLNKILVVYPGKRLLRAQPDTEGVNRCNAFEKLIIDFKIKAPVRPVKTIEKKAEGVYTPKLISGRFRVALFPLFMGFTAIQ